MNQQSLQAKKRLNNIKYLIINIRLLKIKNKKKNLLIGTWNYVILIIYTVNI